MNSDCCWKRRESVFAGPGIYNVEAGKEVECVNSNQTLILKVPRLYRH